MGYTGLMQRTIRRPRLDAERVRTLWRDGLSDHEIATRTGARPGSVRMMRSRLGLPAQSRRLVPSQPALIEDRGSLAHEEAIDVAMPADWSPDGGRLMGEVERYVRDPDHVPDVPDSYVHAFLRAARDASAVAVGRARVERDRRLSAEYLHRGEVETALRWIMAQAWTRFAPLVGEEELERFDSVVTEYLRSGP